MGCVVIKELIYEENEFDIEVDIRKYEQEKLGAFKKSFNTLMQPLALQKGQTTKEKLEEYFNNYYSKEMLSLLEDDQIKIEENLYNSDKIKKLIYFTCMDTLTKTSSGFSIHDKIGYLYTVVKHNLSEEFSKPIEKLDNDLDEFLNELYDLSRIIVKSYLNKFPKPDENGYITSFLNDNDIKQFVINQYKDRLFTIQNGDGNSLNYNQMENQFNVNPLLFTSGDIRYCAWDVIMRNKMPKKTEKKEEEKLD